MVSKHPWTGTPSTPTLRAQALVCHLVLPCLPRGQADLLRGRTGVRVLVIVLPGVFSAVWRAKAQGSRAPGTRPGP